MPRYVKSPFRIPLTVSVTCRNVSHGATPSRFYGAAAVPKQKLSRCYFDGTPRQGDERGYGPVNQAVMLGFAVGRHPMILLSERTRFGTKGGIVSFAMETPRAPRVLPEKPSHFDPNQLSILISRRLDGASSRSSPFTSLPTMAMKSGESSCPTAIFIL